MLAGFPLHPGLKGVSPCPLPGEHVTHQHAPAAQSTGAHWVSVADG